MSILKKKFIEKLQCPLSGERLLENSKENISGLCNTSKKYFYPIKTGIPRFVPESNYADNFGLQWNHFAATQLDSNSGHPISEKRFWDSTGWDPSELDGEWVLDVGCGSGRFAEVALKAGANVVALDYSSAIDACNNNLSSYPNFFPVQGDIFALPFPDESFKYIYSLGVLQHTPDVEKAFMSLPSKLMSEGKICVDFYEKSFLGLIQPKYLLRPLTKRINKNQLFLFLKFITPFLLKLSIMIQKIPFFGVYLKRIIPVANYKGILPLNELQLKEWALLDTFDWLSPTYDKPQSFKDASRMFKRAKLSNIEIFKGHHLVARGVKSLASRKETPGD